MCLPANLESYFGDPAAWLHCHGLRLSFNRLTGTDRHDGDADGATALFVATSRCVWPFHRLLGPAACRGQHEPHAERDTDHRDAHGTCGRPGGWALRLHAQRHELPGLAPPRRRHDACARRRHELIVHHAHDGGKDGCQSSAPPHTARRAGSSGPQRDAGQAAHALARPRAALRAAPRWPRAEDALRAAQPRRDDET